MTRTAGKETKRSKVKNEGFPPRPSRLFPPPNQPMSIHHERFRLQRGRHVFEENEAFAFPSAGNMISD